MPPDRKRKASPREAPPAKRVQLTIAEWIKKATSNTSARIQKPNPVIALQPKGPNTNPPTPNRRKSKPAPAPTSLPFGHTNCPVAGCSNNRGKGYCNVSNLVKHLHSQHLDQLHPEAASWSPICEVIKPRKVCTGCHRIYTLISSDGTCQKCTKQEPAPTKVPTDQTAAGAAKRARLVKLITAANKTRLKICEDIPKPLTRLWSTVCQ